MTLNEPYASLDYRHAFINGKKCRTNETLLFLKVLPDEPVSSGHHIEKITVTEFASFSVRVQHCLNGLGNKRRLFLINATYLRYRASPGHSVDPWHLFRTFKYRIQEIIGAEIASVP